MCVCVTDTIQNRYNIFAVCNAKRRHCFTHHSIRAKYVRCTVYTFYLLIRYSFMLMDFSSTATSTHTHTHILNASYTWIWHLALNLATPFLCPFLFSFSISFRFGSFRLVSYKMHQSYLTTIVHTVENDCSTTRYDKVYDGVILDEHWTRQNCNLVDWGDFLME